MPRLLHNGLGGKECKPIRSMTTLTLIVVGSNSSEGLILHRVTTASIKLVLLVQVTKFVLLG